MKEQEFEITSSLFGGYNKKSTNEYILELQRIIEELQTENAKVKTDNTQMLLKINEAESCYRILWEKCKGQEDQIKKQDRVIMHQQEVLKNLSEREDGISLKKIEGTLAKQMKKLKKKEFKV